MTLPIKSKLKQNFVVGSTWNLVISSMTLAAKFNHDEYEYDKNFAKCFGAKTNHATITMLLHQYLSLIEFTCVVTSEQFNEKLDDINSAVACFISKRLPGLIVPKRQSTTTAVKL